MDKEVLPTAVGPAKITMVLDILVKFDI